jgi:glutamine synthetase
VYVFFIHFFFFFSNLSIYQTTRHCEVAPSQYELAPVFDCVSVAVDQNLMLMMVLREVAEKHGLVALLYEKPFAGVNGSGKHNNWSIITDRGENLLDPTANPASKPKFLLTLAAVLRAVDLHGDLLRVAIAVPGNEHRLGANEAPPAVMSAYLGAQLNSLVESLTADMSDMNLVVDDPEYSAVPRLDLAPGVLPTIPREPSDRNRTSPFAFTTNKFEFRAVGSSQNCGRPVTFLNAMVADSFLHIAHLLEEKKKKREDCDDMENNVDMNSSGENTNHIANLTRDVIEVVKELFQQHKRCVFEGNGYSAAWVEEAVNVRKLWHLKTLPEAVAQLNSKKNICLFESLKIFSRVEVEIQQNTMYENYCKLIAIEGRVLKQMVDSQILPAAIQYKQLIQQTLDLKEEFQLGYFQKLNSTISLLIKGSHDIHKVLEEAESKETLHDEAVFFRSQVVEMNNTLRATSDFLETILPGEQWPFPTYHQILFSK